MIPFPPPPPGEPVVVSATFFVAYRRCPRSAMARLDGIHPPETVRSFAGALAHSVIRRHLERGPIDDIDQACREEIGGGLNHKLGSLRLKPSELRPVIEEIGAMYDRFRTLPADGFEHAEVPLEHDVGEGVTLRGRVDAVFRRDGAVTLTDWKTGGLGEPADQLAFYALLWALSRDELPAQVEACSVQTGERFERSFDPGELAEVAAAVSAVVGEVRRLWSSGADRPTIGGPWCGYCALLDDCTEGRATMSLLGGVGRARPRSASSAT